MGRKTKYFINKDGQFQCEQCPNSYESKPSLIQHIRLKHPKKVSQLQEMMRQQSQRVDDANELVHAKHRTQTLLLEVFQLFLHNLDAIQKEFVEKTDKLRKDTREMVDNVIVLNKLSA